MKRRSKFFILKLLVIKNIKSHLTMWYIILLELLIAIVITIVLIALNRFFVQQNEFVRDTRDILQYEDNMNLSTIDHFMNMSEKYFWKVERKIIYTPDGIWQRTIVEEVAKSLGMDFELVPPERFHSSIAASTFCGIRFNTTSPRTPRSLSYSLVFPSYIRSQKPTTDLDYKSEDLFWTSRMNDIGFEKKLRTSEDTDVYYTEGFLSIQDAVFQAFLEVRYRIKFNGVLPTELRDDIPRFPIKIKQMPFPKYSEVLAIPRPQTFWVEVIYFISYLLPTLYLTSVSFFFHFFFKLINFFFQSL